MFGSSNQLCIGPVALVSLLMGELVLKYDIDYNKYPNEVSDVNNNIFSCFLFFKYIFRRSILRANVPLLLEQFFWLCLFSILETSFASSLTLSCPASPPRPPCWLASVSWRMLLALHAPCLKRVRKDMSSTGKWWDGLPSTSTERTPVSRVEITTIATTMPWISAGVCTCLSSSSFCSRIVLRKRLPVPRHGRSKSGRCLRPWLHFLVSYRFVCLCWWLCVVPQLCDFLLVCYFSVFICFILCTAIIIGAHLAYEIKKEDHFNESIATWPHPDYYARKLKIVDVVTPGLNILRIPTMKYNFGILLGDVLPLTLIAFMESYSVGECCFLLMCHLFVVVYTRWLCVY